MLYRNKREVIPLLLPALLILGFFVYIAVGLNFYYSLFRWSSFSPTMTWVGLDNYIRMAKDAVFWTAMRNTVLFAFWSVVFQVGISLILAGILEQHWMRRFGTICRTVYFLPSMLSMAIVALLWQLMLGTETGFVNDFLKLAGLEMLANDWLGNSKLAIYCVIASQQWQYMGYTTLLFIIAIQKIPEDYIEAARIDGANSVQCFLHVIVPNVKEMILLNMTTTVISGFKTFEAVFAMTYGGPGRSSEVLGTMLFREGFRNDSMGYASALGAIIFLATFLLSAVQLRMYNIREMEEGARG